MWVSNVTYRVNGSYIFKVKVALAEQLCVIIMLGLYLNLMVLFGSPLFGIYSPQPPGHRRVALRLMRCLYIAGAVIGLALSVVSLIVLAASMSEIGRAHV